jgi:Domain of unknown function (DUF4345)
VQGALETPRDEPGEVVARPSLLALERTLYVLAVIPIVAGTATVVLGSASVPAPGAVSANLESELRFYAVWWIAAGVFLAWLAPRVARRTRELRVFCALLFGAGFARVLAILDAGWPSSGQIVLMGIELSLPAILIAWQVRAVRGQPVAATVDAD